MRRSIIVVATVVVTIFAGCTKRESRPAVDTEAIARQAHETYVTAINSNNLDSVLAMLTEDVVYLAPHEPALVGKAAVRPWAEGYLKAFRIHWEKASLEFVVAGDWAFERYAYTSTDTPQGGGASVQDTGKGINIYHHDADGKWRVARDAWNSDIPLPTK